MLDSIELGIASATGNPNDFMVMLYANAGDTGAIPGSSLGTLDGSDNPSTSGVYTYSDGANIILSPNTPYFIVLTAGTASATGAYEWNFSSVNYNLNGGWASPGNVYPSSNGSYWRVVAGDLQFAVNATPVPEPSVLGLLGLSSLFFIRRALKN